MQEVNILGSIIYGAVLGLFVVAFFLRRITATPVLIATPITQASVIALFFTPDLGFLWFNAVGCGIVVGLSLVFEMLRGGRSARAG